MPLTADVKQIAMSACLLVALAGTTSAQEPARLPLSAQTPASARAAGLGNAYLLSAPDADAIFYNPALMDDARGVAGSVSRFGSASQLITAAGSVAWWKGGLGFGASSLSYSAGSIDGGALARGEDALWEQGGVSASEQIAVVSYARALFGFRIGGAGKLIDERVADERSVRGAADIGVARALGPVTLGFSARNLGRDGDHEVIDSRMPMLFTAAAATRSRSLGPLDVAVAGASSWRRGDFHAAGGGVEVSYWPISGRTFTARVGYRWIEASNVSPPTLGAGYAGDRVAIDYAFERIDEGRATHRITLRVR
jgi:hypothetical protein